MGFLSTRARRAAEALRSVLFAYRPYHDHNGVLGESTGHVACSEVFLTVTHDGAARLAPLTALWVFFL